MNNPGIVLTSEGAVIVDPGGSLQSGEMVLRAVKKLTDKPVVAAFNTHVHGDHWLGNQAITEAYPQARIYAHPNMIKRAKAGAGAEWVSLMDNLTDGKSRGTLPVSANSPVDQGAQITIGDTRFDIYHYGINHTDNDIMIAVNGNEALFMGDNLVNGRLGRTTDGNLKNLIAACEEVVQIEPGVIIPGHGPSGGMDMFNYAMDLFRILYATVKAQYDEGLSDFEMKPAVVEALAAYHSWEEFDELVGKTINQAFLEIEAAEF
jgi:glyoxylase-like metal-dependent hydrolase (beta-lactamase superfamily II)